MGVFYFMCSSSCLRYVFFVGGMHYRLFGYVTISFRDDYVS